MTLTRPLLPVEAANDPPAASADPPAASAGAVVIHHSRWRMGLLSLAAVIMVAASVWVLRLEPVVGVLGATFFGTCGAWALWRLCRPRPALVLDAEGLIDQASAAGAGRVRWEEIAGLTIVAVTGQRFLGIVLHDPEAVLLRQPAWRRRLMRANLSFSGHAVCIPESGLSLRAEALLEEVSRFYHVQREGLLPRA